MQVSWIDEEELRALAASLQDAFPSPPSPDAGAVALGTGARASASANDGAGAEPAADVAEGIIASLMDADQSPADPVQTDASSTTVPSPGPVPGRVPSVPVAMESPAAVDPVDPETVDYGLPNLPPEPEAEYDPESEPEPIPASDEDLPEVTMIREQLKVIRDRAEEAGLMPRPAELPFPAPSADSASVPNPGEPALASDSAPSPATSLSPAAASSTPQWALAAEAPLHPNFPALAQAVASITETDPIAPGPAANGAGGGSETASTSTSADFVLPAASTMAERLDTFTQWAGDLTQADQIILMDDYGDLLWGNPETNDLILTAMLALSASSRAQAAELKGPGFLRSRLGTDRELYALPGNTRYGTVTLALINPTGTETTGMAGRLQAALVKSIEG